MRKKTIWIALGCLVVVVLIPLLNLLVGKPRGTALTAMAASDPAMVRVAGLMESSCAHCHVAGTPSPFYASLPLASGMIAADVAKGLRGMDLTAELFPGNGARVSEPALAKIERELSRGNMPPVSYLAAHWNSGLSAAEQATVLEWIANTRAAHHAWLGESDALRGALIPPLPPSLPVDANKVALGRKLYHDKRLSGDDTVSCATCHDLGKGGTDQAQVSTGVRGQKGGINAPTTFNSAFQFVQFWDGRAATLQDQAGGPPNNPVEMDSNWEQIIGKLNADATFSAEFKACYPEGFTDKNITDAIAEFERTLVTPDCRFDKYLRGDTRALSADELRGHDVFKDAGCATCHSGVLLGGASYELMGRHADYFKDRGTPVSDADKGRMNASKDPKDLHRFKVPTLRNIARTFPYFHDGSANDLKQAVTTMAKYQCNEKLSDADVAALVAFLETLTGQYEGKPL